MNVLFHFSLLRRLHTQWAKSPKKPSEGVRLCYFALKIQTATEYRLLFRRFYPLGRSNARHTSFKQRSACFDFLFSFLVYIFLLRICYKNINLIRILGSNISFC